MFVLMIRRPPRSTRTDTLLPYTTLFRSVIVDEARHADMARAIELSGRSPLVLTLGGGGEHDLTGLVAKEPGSRITLRPIDPRSEEHTSELQSLMRISYAVFCLKKKNSNLLLILTISQHTAKNSFIP